jgi:propionyl-CoA carboxylase beta chain
VNVIKQILDSSLACRVMPLHEPRTRVCRSLVMIKDKKLEYPRRKHGNIPL